MLTKLKEGLNTKCADYTGGYLQAPPYPPSTAVGQYSVCGAEHAVCFPLLGIVASAMLCVCPYGHTIPSPTTQIVLQSPPTQPLDGVELRRFAVTYIPTNTTRTISHYLLASWADHSVPESPAHLVNFVHFLHKQRHASDAPPPPVLHCSAGIGRTGTLVVVDVAVQRLWAALRDSDAGAIEQAVALEDLLLYLRHQRHGLVQTLDQYVFCYKALLEELKAVAKSDIKL